MEQLTSRKRRLLDAMDEEIAELEKKLAKYQPFFDELNQIRRARATLLNERTATGGLNGRTRLTMESIIQTLRDNDNEPMTPTDIAVKLGVNDNAVRSHLNRHLDQRYRKEESGWVLIGEEDEE